MLLDRSEDSLVWISSRRCSSDAARCSRSLSSSRTAICAVRVSCSRTKQNDETHLCLCVLGRVFLEVAEDVFHALELGDELPALLVALLDALLAPDALVDALGVVDVLLHNRLPHALDLAQAVLQVASHLLLGVEAVLLELPRARLEVAHLGLVPSLCLDEQSSRLTAAAGRLAAGRRAAQFVELVLQRGDAVPALAELVLALVIARLVLLLALLGPLGLFRALLQLPKDARARVLELAHGALELGDPRRLHARVLGRGGGGGDEREFGRGLARGRLALALGLERVRLAVERAAELAELQLLRGAERDNLGLEPRAVGRLGALERGELEREVLLVLFGLDELLAQRAQQRQRLYALLLFLLGDDLQLRVVGRGGRERGLGLGERVGREREGRGRRRELGAEGVDRRRLRGRLEPVGVAELVRARFLLCKRARVGGGGGGGGQRGAPVVEARTNERAGLSGARPRSSTSAPNSSQLSSTHVLQITEARTELLPTKLRSSPSNASTSSTEPSAVVSATMRSSEALSAFSLRYSVRISSVHLQVS